MWSRDGTELFFSHEGQVWAVSVDVGSTLGLGTPTALFYWPNGLGLRYDVLDDGQFVMVRTDPDAGPNRFRVVLNWTQELLERVPVP